MRRLAMILMLGAAVAVGIGCSEPAPTAPAGPAAETVSPKDSPIAYKVLDDETDKAKNTVEYHVLIAPSPKHDAVDGLLKYLYRHLMQRREDAPAGFAGYVYTDESQYKTPPRSPIATVIQQPGDVGPKFDNKVPLEFWQQIDQALEHHDQGWKLAKKIVRDDNAKTLTITVPYTEPGKDQYADKLSFNMAMNIFTDTAQALFDKVPELSAMTFIGTWNNDDVVKISLDRATYQKLNLADIDEQIGQLHGRAFLELATGKSSDAKAAKENSKRLAAVYKKMLSGLKGHETVSPKLK